MENQSSHLTKEQFLFVVASEFESLIDNSEVRNFIACQFALESDFGKSFLALYENNYCGMRCAKKRLTTRIKSHSGNFASYISFEDCAIDYMLWLTYNECNQCILNSLEKFKEFLSDSPYCPETDYVERIDKIYKQFFN